MKRIGLFLSFFLIAFSCSAHDDADFDRLKIVEKRVKYRNKVLGALLGSAIGDALGRIPEKYWIYGGSLGGNMFAQSQRDLWRKQFPEGVRDLKDFRKQDFVNGLALYTDDTQMSLMVLDALLEQTGVQKKSFKSDDLMVAIAERFAQWAFDPKGGLSQHRAPGVGCTRAARRLYSDIQKRDQGERLPDRWWAYGEGGVLKPLAEGGCGSVMRSFPFGLIFPHNRKLAADLAQEHSLLTHRVPMARAACAAMAAGIARAAVDSEIVSIHEIIKEMIEVAQKYDPHTAAMMREERGYAERLLKKNLPQAEAELRVRDRLELLEGKLAHQSIAATVFVITYENKDLIHAIQLAINFYGDSDSVGAMVGALLGAYLGCDVLCQLDNYNRFLARLENHGRFFLLADEIVKRADDMGCWEAHS